MDSGTKETAKYQKNKEKSKKNSVSESKTEPKRRKQLLRMNTLILTRINIEYLFSFFLKVHVFLGPVTMTRMHFLHISCREVLLK